RHELVGLVGSEMCIRDRIKAQTFQANCAIMHGFSLPQIQQRVSKDERYAFPYFSSSGSD
ncbi:hypothetical protein ACN6QF_18305, partial [Acinetobacter baumannii]